ncbi:MAG: hypothetical protein AB1414_01155 [bacterium]
MQTIREITKNKLENLWQNLGKITKEQLSQELVELSALLGNFSEALVDLEKAYTEEKLRALKLTEKVNQAEILAKNTPAYQEYQKARLLEKAVNETIRSLKYRIRTVSEEEEVSKNL